MTGIVSCMTGLVFKITRLVLNKTFIVLLHVHMRTGSVQNKTSIFLNMTVLFLRLIHKSLIGFICRAGLRSTGRFLPPWARPTPSAPSCHPSSSGNPASASRVWPERFARLCPAPPPGVFWSLFHTRYCTTRHTYTLSKVLVASILSHLGTTHPLAWLSFCDIGNSSYAGPP